MTPPAAPLCPAWLLLLAAVLLGVCATCAGHPAVKHCHRSDCSKAGREYCEPGSSRCGPCRSPLEEDAEGRCVFRNRQHPKSSKKKQTFFPGVDEEIDYLHAVIEKQQISQTNPPKQQALAAAVVVARTDVNKAQPHRAFLKKQKSGVQLAKAVLSNATTARPAASGKVTPTPQPAVSAHLQSTFQPRVTKVDSRRGPVPVRAHRNDGIIVIFISLCVVVGTAAVIVATVCYFRMQKESRLAQKLDYPAFRGASAPPAAANGISTGDKTLAQNAQMYHYQHQKQQMLSLGKRPPEQKVLDAEATSEEEEVGGDFTVYECPGLAPTGEMEVKNPLFDDSTEQYQQNQK